MELRFTDSAGGCRGDHFLFPGALADKDLRSAPSVAGVVFVGKPGNVGVGGQPVSYCLTQFAGADTVDDEDAIYSQSNGFFQVFFKFL